MPNIGPKNEEAVSKNDKIPIWLSKGCQKRAIKKAKKAIITPELFKFNLLGKKFNNVFCVGI